MGALPPIELPRSVEDNKVFCPVVMGYVDVGRCTRCGFLQQPVHDQTGRMTGFVCTPSRGAWLSGMSI